MSKGTELLPCMCGRPDPTMSVRRTMKKGAMAYVYCPTCECEGNRAKHADERIACSRAAKQWNKLVWKP